MHHAEHTLSLSRTLAHMPPCSRRMAEMIFCGTPKRANTVQEKVRSTESYALLRSIKHTKNGIRFVPASTCSRQVPNIIPMVKRFGRKPLCYSGRIPTRSQYSLRWRARIVPVQQPFRSPTSGWRVAALLLSWAALLAVCSRATFQGVQRRSGRASMTWRSGE